MSKNKARRVSVNEAIEAKAAQVVADEALRNLDFDASPEERDIDQADEELEAATPEEVDRKDVFVDGIMKARAKNLTPLWRIYRDGNLLGTKEGNYSWEKLQTEFGGGWYRVSCVAKHLNTFLCTQSQGVEGSPNLIGAQTTAAPQTPVDKNPTTFEMIEAMNQASREAKAETQAQANSQVGLVTSFMQTMMTQQQQAAAQFNALLLEMQKQRADVQAQASRDAATANDKMFTLLTSMLTQKPKGDDLSARELQKMAQEAEDRGYKRATETYKLIEDKVEKGIAEREDLVESSKPDDKEEESLSKTLLKSFVPVLGQMLSQGPPPGAAMHQGPPQEFVPQVPPPGTLRPEDVQATPEQVRRLRHATDNPPGVARPAPVKQAPPPVVAKDKATAVAARDVTPTVVGSNGGSKVVNAKSTEEAVREKLFQIVGTDIGAALVSRKEASKTAAQCLKKLENNGITRQTVLDVFSLPDLIRYARQNGIPELADPWFQEFHESLSKNPPSDAASVRKPQPGAEPRGESPTAG